ncbi:PREDICTED: CMRF35-like molecule 5 isoform X2 [Gekko japonicus]|uniref:CMRF35-like molecule 5 isoform X2 n=1 Tax=Gekko japonicus TaxID=146911 RepID=A0ABM1JXR1_GEKJA|nr:PREDICTED: CMRF35-like molecule 5 isoform X2 [Gekko japonicus]
MLLLHLTGSICISLLPGFTSAVKGPGTVHGFVGRSLPVMCHYDKSYQTYYKYWCKGYDWLSCTVVVKTRGLEAEVKAGRTSVKDNHTCSCFTVTLEDLREEDAGVYWCGIETSGSDPNTQVTIVPESSSDLTDPKAVEATVGSSVSVECSYDQRYQQNIKYWCRRISERNCPPGISTTGSERPVIKNGVSIQDNHSLNHFTVTMDDLTTSHSGMYSCAVSQPGGLDLMTPVNVTVLVTDVPDSRDRGGFFQNYQIYVTFLVLICMKMPIFLTMVLAITWMHRRNRQHSDEL